MSHLPDDWHNHEGARGVYQAALTGIIANPTFFGPIFQGEPQAAHDFALNVLRAAYLSAQRDEGGERG